MGKYEEPITKPYICLWDIEDKIIPPDMLRALCVDSNGTLFTIVTRRLLYRKLKADVLRFCQENSTYGAMVSISLTGRGMTTSMPVAITGEESVVLDRIVDTAFNHPNLVSTDGKIPSELRWAPLRIIKTAVEYIEQHQSSLLSQEQNILDTISPPALADLERKGIFITSDSPIPNKILCPTCRSEYAPGQRFCGSCGARLK